MPSRRTAGSSASKRRKHSLGNLRRAHPASGATWNVQVVRGKMSSKCLWHACRALILGVTLLLLGAGMATLGKCPTICIITVLGYVDEFVFSFLFFLCFTLLKYYFLR